jgi:hypothetical protein
MLYKLEKLLLGKAEKEEKAAEALRQAAENAGFDRLEAILIAQQEAEIEKDKAEQKAAAENAAQIAEMRKMIREDKLIRIKELILSQREEQLEREAAAEAARNADSEAAKLVALKAHQEKEALSALLGAAMEARKEAETEAAEQAEQADKVRKAHEGALSEAQRAVRDMESLFEEERQLREKVETVEDERSAIEKARLAENNLVDMVYGKEEKKWYMTAKGPACIDTSDGCFARQILNKAQQEEREAEKDEMIIFSLDATPIDLEYQQDSASDTANGSRSVDMIHSPNKYHLIFPAGTKQTVLQDNEMLIALQREGVESLFEMDTLQLKDTTPSDPFNSHHDTTVTRSNSEIFISSSLLWQRLPADGQSELYQSLCKSGWKPTYLRSSGKYF